MWTAILSGLGSFFTLIGQSLGLVTTVQQEKNTPQEIAAEEAAREAAAQAQIEKEAEEAANTGNINNLP